MAARVVKITDGTDTVDFEDANSGYELLTFRPAVAQYDENNPEVWSRVDEVLEISVEGDTQTEMAQRLHLLTELVERARRLMRGENVAPVIFQYRIDDSLLTNPLQSLIVGPTESGEMLTLPESFDNYSQLKTGDVGDPVVWRFRRRGALLGDEENANSSQAETGTKQTVTLTADPELLSPMDLRVSFELSSTLGFPAHYLCLAPPNQLAAIDPTDLNTDGGLGYTHVADSSNYAFGGNVLRYTPTGTTEVKTNLSVSLANDFRRVRALAKVRNNSGSTMFDMTIRFSHYDQDYIMSGHTKTKTIDASSTLPRIIDFGYVSMPLAPTDMFVALQASAAADSLDIDEIVLVGENGYIISVAERNPFVSDMNTFTERFETIPFELSRPRGIFYRETAATGHITNPLSPSYSGNIYLQALGTQVSALFFSTGFVTDSPTPYQYWRWEANNASAVQEHVMTIRRWPAYLVPQ